eukprot:9515_1
MASKKRTLDENLKDETDEPLFASLSQQVESLQDELASMREKVQDKQYIINNLMLRYDLGIISEDSNRKQSSTDEIDPKLIELHAKAEALAQRTILENFELREMINTLREENFTIRHECYEKQDKIDSQFSKMDKLQNVHKTRMDHVTKLLNAYGLEERFPIDRRDMYIREFEGDSMLVYAYIRNELETQYDVHILSDVKDLITRFAARTYDIVDEESATEECFEEEESQKSTSGDASLDQLSDEEEHDVICID